ncbi:Lar family restriction alleviation protein [Pseudomonas sp. PARCl1]|uniref:Lar family restriction alleviation protein n=1 Tax=Pseudomonas sp. PARCl1 TaxID=2853444 RepID=UPI00248F3018|nr:Lar family restriction alleviation protein [Pseudomonas sp. PARCl1]
MPTENRSSNTEMVSELLPCPFCGEKPQITKHHREDIYSFMHRCPVLGPISWGFREDQQAHIEKWNARAQPAPQPHPEPIAWMVGTAFWWTKEEAERDAAATGLPIVGLGPMSDTGTVDQLSQIIRDLNDERDGIGAEAGRLRAQLAERDALLTRALPYLSNTPDLVQHGAEDLAEEIRSASAGRPCYGPNEWGTECGKCSKCKSASAEPSAPVERMSAIRSEAAELSSKLKNACCQSCMSNPCDCAIQSAPVEIDERAELEAYCTKVGLPLDRLPSGEYMIPATRFVSQGWHAHAASSRKQ